MIDAPPAIDAAPDAPTPKQLGTACTPNQQNPQGDCDAGQVCLQAQGGTGAFCTKTCTPGAGDTCATGYTGPGRAACVLGVQSGQQVVTLCGVICQLNDTTMCSASVCNGTCPGALMCNGPLQNQQMQTVGQACR